MICSKCKINQHVQTPGSHNTWCKECKYAGDREGYKSRYGKAKRERQAIYQKANHDRYLAYQQQYRRGNRPKCAANTQRYNASKMHRTPSWLTRDDFKLMEMQYQLAHYLSIETGIEWQVDHIVPLQGKNVSGLHVPSNLRVIPKLENITKGNRNGI